MFGSFEMVFVDLLCSYLFIFLSEVHDLPGIRVHRDSSGHRSRGPVLRSSGEVTALARVMLLLDQMVPGPEGHQVGVVSRRRDGHGPRAPHISMAQLVRQLLQLIRIKAVVVPEDVIVGRPRRTLDTLVGAEVEVEFGGVSDADVDRGTRGYVAGLARLLLFVRAEKSRVMALLDDDERDAGFVVQLEFDAGLADGRELVLQDL